MEELLVFGVRGTADEIARNGTDHLLHLIQVVDGAVRVEHHGTIQELEHHTANRPNVDWSFPRHLQHHFGCAVMSRLNQVIVAVFEFPRLWRVGIVSRFIDRRAEVDDLDPRVERNGMRLAMQLNVLGTPIYKHHVLWLQVGEDDAQMVHELDGIADLVG